MFIRLRRQKSTAKNHWDKSDSISAILVKSERINGQPRQKYLTYLGTIRERHIISSHIWVIVDFYNQVEQTLSDYGLSESEIEKLLSGISNRIPRYTKAEASEAIQLSMAKLREVESRIENAM